MNRYDNSPIKTTSQGKRFYKQKFYPNIPLSDTDEYVITTIGDRLDYMAYTYYRDSELYWIISVANNNVTKGSLFPIPGTQMRIPSNVSSVISLFNKFNKVK